MFKFIPGQIVRLQKPKNRNYYSIQTEFVPKGTLDKLKRLKVKMAVIDVMLCYGVSSWDREYVFVKFLLDGNTINFRIDPRDLTHVPSSSW